MKNTQNVEAPDKIEEEVDPENLESLAWDGPEDSDEEVPEMVALKTEWEKENGIRFSKRGIINYCENLIATDCIENDNAWDLKLKSPNIMYYIRKGGSSLHQKSPYMR